MPYSALLNLGSSWTIIAIVRFLRLSSEAVFSTFESSGGALRGYSLEFANTQVGSYCLVGNRLQSRLGTGVFSNHIKQSNANTVTTSDWRMVTAVCTGGTTGATVTFYNNATSSGAGTWCAGYTAGAINYGSLTSSIRIGSINAAGYDVNYANIALSRLLIYKKSLTSADVASTYAQMKRVHPI